MLKFIKLFLLLIILIGQPSFGQNQLNSKILGVLNHPLNANEIYHANYDTLIELIKGDKISYENEVVFEGNRGNIHFEKAIYINAPDDKYTFLDHYIPFQIAFYFNEKKLQKSVWFFDLKFKKAESIKREISKIIKNYDDYGGGVTWSDNFASLTLNRGDQASLLNMKLLVDTSVLKEYADVKMQFSIEFTMLDIQEKQSEIERQQPKSAYEKIEGQIKEDRKGKGSGTFALTLSKLESIIKSNTTLKARKSVRGMGKRWRK